jgi:hypothetical protein
LIEVIAAVPVHIPAIKPRPMGPVLLFSAAVSIEIDLAVEIK